MCHPKSIITWSEKYMLGELLYNPPTYNKSAVFWTIFSVYGIRAMNLIWRTQEVLCLNRRENTVRHIHFERIKNKSNNVEYSNIVKTRPLVGYPPSPNWCAVVWWVGIYIGFEYIFFFLVRTVKFSLVVAWFDDHFK